MFTTEAVTGGLPIHIAAKILGHANLSTTPHYLAVFQDDMIRTYRSFLDRRRLVRPEAEYREPTEQEWREFHQHFHERKLELGTCGRPYGTPCQHEHACVRCPMLRVDPKQRSRLVEIISSLGERIKEARMNGWLGEVQGLQTSLDAAAKKLVALDRSIAQASRATTDPTNLASRPPHGRAISVTDNVRPHGGQTLFSASLQLTHGARLPSIAFTAKGVRLMLEVIDKGSCSESHPVPLLFVHGAWHAAWCWDEHFLDYFADKGYRAMAVSLRGHGNSPAPKPLRACSLADYVADVESVAKSLPTSPVVIGHSMGGFVVQKYLESRDAPAGVLIASAPQRGSLGFTMRLTRRHPWLITKGLITGNALLAVGTPDLARESFFSARTPESDVVRYAARLNSESQRVVLDTMLFLPRPKRVTTPLLVLGAEFDRSILPKEVHATARAYRTEAEIFPEMGHDMMLEPGWDAVAQRIHTWLETLAPMTQSRQSGEPVADQ